MLLGFMPLFMGVNTPPGLEICYEETIFSKNTRTNDASSARQY